MGKVSGAIWSENERKQLKCWCIDTELPSLLLTNSAKLPSQANVRRHISQLSPQSNRSSCMCLAHWRFWEHLPNKIWKPELLNKDNTHLDVHGKIFYQSPGRKRKQHFLSGMNVFTLVFTWVSILWCSELSMHSSSIFPRCNFISRKYLILDMLSGPFCL